SKATGVGRCRRKRVLTPGLANLFEPLRIVSAATHSVKVLRNKRMLVTRQGNPSHVLGPFITRIGTQGETDEAVHLTSFVLNEVKQLTHDDIGPRNSPDCRHQSRLWLAVNKLVDLDRLHRRANGDFSDDCAGI